MRIFQKYFGELLGFILCLTLAVVALTFFIPKQPNLMKPNEQRIKYKDSLEYVAIGDSLTEGIGDIENKGGYVPIVTDKLREATGIEAIDASNFGKAGDTSSQIKKRIESNDEIQASLKKADFILLTVGGNDLMKVIRKQLFKELDVATFAKPATDYQNNLSALYETIRMYNKKAPIFQLGIYNPFYLTFQEIEGMNEIVTRWNERSELVTKEDKRAYFVPIDELLSSGMDTTSETTENNLLSDEDKFHPNRMGYQLIANQFTEKLISEKSEWLEKK